MLCGLFCVSLGCAVSLPINWCVNGIILDFVHTCNSNRDVFARLTPGAHISRSRISVSVVEEIKIRLWDKGKNWRQLEKKDEKEEKDENQQLFEAIRFASAPANALTH